MTMQCLCYACGANVLMPNLTPVFLTLGGMGWTGVPLDYVRLLIAPVGLLMGMPFPKGISRLRQRPAAGRGAADAMVWAVIEPALVPVVQAANSLFQAELALLPSTDSSISSSAV